MKKLIDKNDSFFVAGHNGMVGSAIIRELKRKGYCSKKNKGKLYIQSKKELDLTDNDKVRDWFKSNRPSVVILAAAKVGGILANNSYPYDFLSENLKIQQNVIEAAWKNGAKRLLFLGSSCIYPKYSKTPINEEELLTGSLENTNEAYAIAKIAGIKLCESLIKQHNFDCICLMPTNLYGQNDNYHQKNSHVVPALIRKFFKASLENKPTVECWGTGKPLREFLHVDDLAAGCIHSLEYWNPIGEFALKNKNDKLLNYLNIGSGIEISIKELAYLISDCIGYKGKIIWDESKPDGTFKKNLDSSRIQSLGWKPKIGLKEGIKKTIEDFKSKYLKGEESIKNFVN